MRIIAGRAIAVGADFAVFTGMSRSRFRRRGPKLPSGRRRQRRLHSVLIAGATTFFVPHAGRVAPRPRPHPTPVTSTAGATRPPRAVLVTLNEDYKPRREAYDPIIDDAAATYGVDAALIRAVITTESAFDPLAVSTAGALGLMQLMPALAAELGVTDVFDARQNIMAGTRYLADLLYVHGGNVPLALASYNAGPGAVARYGGIPPFEETQTYVRRITNLVDAELKAN